MANSVREVMAQSVETVEPSAPVADAARKMRDADTGAIVVVEDGQVRGIVTDRDIVVRAVAEGRGPDDVTVQDVCTSDPTTLSPDDDLDSAVSRMREQNVRRLPVVEDGQAVGVLSLGDLAMELDEESALADISSAAPNT